MKNNDYSFLRKMDLSPYSLFGEKIWGNQIRFKSVVLSGFIFLGKQLLQLHFTLTKAFFMNDERRKVLQVLLKINTKKWLKNLPQRRTGSFWIAKDILHGGWQCRQKVYKVLLVLNWFPTQIPNGNSSSIHTVKCRNIQLIIYD